MYIIYPSISHTVMMVLYTVYTIRTYIQYTPAALINGTNGVRVLSIYIELLPKNTHTPTQSLLLSIYYYYYIVFAIGQGQEKRATDGEREKENLCRRSSEQIKILLPGVPFFLREVW